MNMLAILPPCPVPLPNKITAAPSLAKPCRLCGVTKLVAEFYDAPSNRDGKTSECKPCHNEKSRRYQQGIANGTIAKRKRFDANAKTKSCTKCKVEKPLSDFSDLKSRPGRRQSKCKACARAYDLANSERLKLRAANYKLANDERLKQYYRDTREHHLAKHAEYYATARGRAVRLYNSAKKSPDGCTLTLDHIIRGIETGACPMTGIPFDLRPHEKRRSGRQTNPFAPSLDRLDPNKGYTDNNVRVVIWHYNAMKGELTDAEVLSICQHVVAKATAK